MLVLLFPLLYFVESAVAIDSLKVAFQWRLIDFEYSSENAKLEATANSQFIPENNIPLGLEIYQDRIFITLPRWREGVAASLAYIKTSDPQDSPVLRPYPNWAAHDQSQKKPEIVSAIRMKADSCGRLWVLDAGLVNIIVNGKNKQKLPPRVLIYDLKTDKLIHTYEVPKGQWNAHSFFANIVVEENNCENSFAYLADIDKPALVVYDLKQNKSWIVQHHYFNMDPLAGNLTVSGINFQWTDGIFGLSLSDRDVDGYSTLYFHPLTSFNEFAVSTKVLRNETLLENKQKVFNEFKYLGSRGPKGESGVSFLHKKTGVIFYALVNLNAVICWRTALKNYTMESQGRVFMSDELMVFPNDIKVDDNDTLWVLSDKLPVFLHGLLNYREYNFRILKSSVKEAIVGTTCDSTMVVNSEIMKNITGRSSSSDVKNQLLLTVFVVLTLITLR